MKTKKVSLQELKNIIINIAKEELNKNSKSLSNNSNKLSEIAKNLNEAKRGRVDRKYTHFAIRKSDNKIVTGWEYKNLDRESIAEYTKEDLKDMFPDSKYSDFKIISKQFLKTKGIDPFDTDNWSN